MYIHAFFSAASADHAHRFLLTGFIQWCQISSLGRGGWLVVWSPIDLVHTWMGHLPDIQPPKSEGIFAGGMLTVSNSHANVVTSVALTCKPSVEDKVLQC